MLRRATAFRPALEVLLALVVATVVWLPTLHLLFRPRPPDIFSSTGLSPTAQSLAARHLSLWSDPRRRQAEIERMRESNAEWDFMARTFLVLALANISLRDPASRPRCLEAMDLIIEETLRAEREGGLFHFLMPYAKHGEFVSSVRRSLFQDGEIGLMLAARRLIDEKPAYRPALSQRVISMAAQMEESPVLSGESYPNECWTFCNSIALAAMRMADALDGSDHSAFVRSWLATARQRLVDPETGLLVSSFTFAGEPKDGPEGSSIWTAAHFLRTVDRPFAEDQYARAKRELAGDWLGFGYAREWPSSWIGHPDIDSGPIIPFLHASLSSSGQALLGATTFDDADYAVRLMSSANLGGFPIEADGRLRYAASNAVGDAVVLYALVQGPLWAELDKRTGSHP